MKPRKKKIIPVIEKCICGKKVTDHHYFCNKCYSERDKIKYMFPDINTQRRELRAWWEDKKLKHWGGINAKD